MTSVIARVSLVVRLGTLAWTVVAAAVALGQATGRPSGVQDTSVPRQPATGLGQSPATNGSIVGVVIDSLNGGPLVGAQISVEGIVSGAVSDSTGRFRMDSIPVGRYRVGVFHPLIDSLGLSIASPPVEVAAGTTLALVFATPSAPTFLRLKCSDAPVDSAAGTGPSMLIGRVLDAETEAPAAGASVSLTWTEMQATRANGVRRVLRVRDTTTGPTGEFRFCHLPPNLAGSARAIRLTGDSSVVSRPYGMNARLVGFLVLHLPSIDTIASRDRGGAASDSSPAPASGHAMLTGRVMRSDGAGPFAGAQVTVTGSKQTAVTGDSGQFALRGLPTGTHTVQVRALGWEPVAQVVELSAHAPRQVVVVLRGQTAVLKAVVVKAKLNAGLHNVGFDARRRMGTGHFLTADDIAKRDALEFLDLMTVVPGVTRRMSPTGQDYLTGTRGAGGCVSYVLDGMAYLEVTQGDINYVVHPTDIGAIEVYQPGEAPAQYLYTPPTMAPLTSGRLAAIAKGTMVSGDAGNGGTTCVKVIIWTKARLGL
jgi:Carboxypeptidase regulatory-like domain/TonB-dependent Receptor Plug Domain